MTFPFPTFSPSVAVGASIAHNFEDSDQSTTDLTTYTFSTKNIGTAAADRRVIVGVVGSNNTQTVTSMTIAGISAALLVGWTSAGARTEFWMALVPTGTTGTIVVNWGGTQSNCGIGIWSCTGLTDNSILDWAGGTITSGAGTDITVDTINGGFALAIGMSYSPGAINLVWTNATEDYEADLDSSSNRHGGASVPTTGSSLTVNVECNNFGNGNAPALLVSFGGSDTPYNYAGVTDAYEILGSSLQGWYAADLISGSDTDPQSEWLDRSGKRRHAWQQSAKPTLKTADLNSLNVIRFTSASSQFFNFPSIFDGVTAGSVYLVIKVNADPPGAGGDTGMFHMGTDTVGSHYPWTDGSIYETFGATVRKSPFNPTPALTAYRIYHVYSASADWAAYIDGVSVASTGTNTVGFPSAPMLGRSFGANFLNGWIAEAIFTNAKQSSGDREKIEGYLAHKWWGSGASNNLDSGHPYKNSPPGGGSTSGEPIGLLFLLTKS